MTKEEPMSMDAEKRMIAKNINSHPDDADEINHPQPDRARKVVKQIDL